MIIEYVAAKNPTFNELEMRVYELERALSFITVLIAGARNSLDMPREYISPLAVKVQIEQALRIIKQVI